jgi:branched-chain amino acid transport system permease protein
MNWMIQALNGLSMGALLFMLASGFSLTFGLMRVVNMAHGTYYLFGGYIGYSVVRSTGSFWLGLLAGSISVAVLGLLCERFLFQRVRDNDLSQILLSLGLAMIIADVCLAIWGGNPLKVRLPEWATGAVQLTDSLAYPKFRFIILIFGLFMALALWLMQERTAIGTVVRAGVDDREMVSALGVNVNALFSTVFTFGAFLAGMSGVIGGGFLALYPHADWEILSLALVVVIVGGLGSLKGAFIGSLMVGLVDAFGRWLMPELAYFMVFAPMAILLSVRPTGLFGKEG